MKILVTGAQGYLGGEVVKQLARMNLDVYGTGRRIGPKIYKCDLTKSSEVSMLISQIAPDRIVHCAAVVPRKSSDYNDAVNAASNITILDSLIKSTNCPIIYISSMTVYGNQYSAPVRECDNLQSCLSAYGAGKFEEEQQLIVSGRQGFVIRIPGLFGLPRKCGLIYNVLSSYKNGRLPSLPNLPIVWAAMHVRDAAKSIAILATSTMNEKAHILNLGYRGITSIEHMVNIACDIYKVDRYYNTVQPIFEYNLSRADIYKAVPEISFADALRKFGNEI